MSHPFILLGTIGSQTIVHVADDGTRTELAWYLGRAEAEATLEAIVTAYNLGRKDAS